nr:helitron helicase-like domain-containing protein [Tanacetum cinerariifolium]
MLLMQAQENGVVLDEEKLLFIVGGQDSNFDDDVDEPPVQDLALNVDNVYQANKCDDFDFDYVKDNAVQVVQSNVSLVPNDSLMMIINDMHEQVAKCVSANEQNKVVNESLTAKLARYKEHVKIYEKGQDPTSYLEGCSMGDEYSKRNSTNRGPVILDFENSVVHLPSVMGASSGFEAVNIMDSSATKTKYPANVDCHGISIFGNTNSIHTNGESSTNNLNGEGHLWPTDDFKGPVVLDFENQAVHLSSIVGISTGFQIGNDVEMSIGKNNNSLNIDHLDSPLLGDMNSLQSNGQNNAGSVAHKPVQTNNNVDFRKSKNTERLPLSNVATASTRSHVNSNCEGVSSCYIDIEDCDCSCQYCGAKFWYREQVKD